MKLPVLALAFSLGISACQASVEPISTLRSDDTTYAELEAEYAPFSTQALTQNYLTRKVQRWLTQPNGTSMVREIDFARQKHPAVMTQLMQDTELCQQTVSMHAVSAYRSSHPNFDHYLDGFSCQQPIAQGEFLVNSYQTGTQAKPAVAMQPTGGFLVGWQGKTPLDSEGVAARYFNAAGQALPEFQVNTLSASTQENLQISSNALGHFLLAWDGNTFKGGAAPYYPDVYAQRLKADASLMGSEFRVDETVNTVARHNPAVALAADNSFVTVWRRGIIFHLKRYDVSGAAVGSPVMLEETQYEPQIVMAANGNFVVVWADRMGLSSYSGLYFQRYAANGTPLGSAVLVTSSIFHTSNLDLDLAMASNGKFVVTWAINNALVLARYYDADGTALTDEFQVTSEQSTYQLSPAVAMNNQGFVISWAHRGNATTLNEIYAQRYNAQGLPNGAHFRVNSTVVGDQRYPAVAMAEDGSMVIAWDSNDANGTGIYAQRYNAQGIAQ